MTHFYSQGFRKSSKMATGVSKEIRYVYELPYETLSKFKDLLDADGRWEELGGKYLDFGPIDLRLIGQAVLRKESPTEELLRKWGERNGTINQLFVYLYKLGHFHAMTLIKDFAHPKYWYLLEQEHTKYSSTASLYDAPYCNREKAHCTAPPESEMEFTSARKYNPVKYNVNLTDSQRNLKAGSKVGLVSGLPGQRRSQFAGCNNAQVESNTNNNCLDSRAHRVSTASLRNENNSERKVRNVPLSNHSENLVRQQPISFRSNISFKELEAAAAGLKKISYETLYSGTDGFSKRNILGKGGFGAVYKGIWKNTPVAIKRLYSSDARSTENRFEVNIKQTLNEVTVLTSCHIDTILPLYGVSYDGPELCLVYKYMKNGSLEDRLKCRNNTQPLTWSQRGSIALGVAIGLNFLHTNNENPLIHGDIKCANILLDENMQPKIGDYGLTRPGPSKNLTSVKVSRVHGTRHYLPHEYLQDGRLSTKVDVYCYGIVLLEMATNEKVYDDKRQKSKKLVDLVDDCIRDNMVDSLRDSKAGEEDTIWFNVFIQFGKKCSSYDKRDRPDMEEVVKHLEQNPKEIVRRLSTEARISLMPYSVNPTDLQIWHDIRAASKQNQSKPGVSTNGPAGPTGLSSLVSKFPQVPPGSLQDAVNVPVIVTTRPPVMEEPEAALEPNVPKGSSSSEELASGLPLVTALGKKPPTTIMQLNQDTAHEGNLSGENDSDLGTAPSPSGIVSDHAHASGFSANNVIVTPDLRSGSLVIPPDILEENDISLSELSLHEDEVVENL